jgi:hypothetical protein
VTGGIGPVPVSVSGTRDLALGTCEQSQLLEQGSKGASCGRRQASHVTVVLSKAALSGPSVCLRARAPCPLRVSCPGADRAKRAAKLQALALRCLLGSRQVYSPDVQLTHGLIAILPGFASADRRTRTGLCINAASASRGDEALVTVQGFANTLHDRRRGRVCAGHRRDHLHPDCSDSDCSGSFLL